MGEIARFDFGTIEGRMGALVARLSSELDDPQGCCSESAELTENAAQLVGEEKLFYVLLATHFASPRTAREFYSRLDWNRLLKSNTTDLRGVSAVFFQGQPFIGDHRRHFRALETTGQKIQFTVEVLEAYKATMQTSGSQARFFETSGHPGFDVLSKRMREIKHFHPRLPRFDHLERLARTHNFYIVPTRFYADEDQGGPRDGLTYLLLGLRLRHTKGLKAYLVSEFLHEWNVAVDAKYRITQGATLREVLHMLEIWTIDHVREQLPSRQRNEPAYVFELESCLCNWQKRK